MLAPCRRLGIRWFATVLNFCEIFAQRYVAAPDHSPDTAICVGDVERHTGSAPDSPDRLLRIGLTYKFRSYSRRLRRCPGHLAGAFFVQIDPAWLNLRDLCSSQIARV
jgi:hypothetical protein